MNIKEFFDLMGPEIESWVGEKIYNTCTKVRPGSPIQIYLEPTFEEEFYVFYGPDTDPLIFSTWEWEKEFKEISKLIPIKRKLLGAAGNSLLESYCQEAELQIKDNKDLNELSNYFDQKHFCPFNIFKLDDNRGYLLSFYDGYDNFPTGKITIPIENFATAMFLKELKDFDEYLKEMSLFKSSNSLVIKNNNKDNITIKGDNNMALNVNFGTNENSKNLGLNLDFGPCNNSNIRMSLYGIAVKNNSGNYVSYDKNFGNIVDVDIINFKGDKCFWKIPVAIKDIKVGDTIVHNRVPMFVESVDNGDIKAIDIGAAEKKEIIPITNVFGFNFVTKVVSIFDSFGGNVNASADNPFGNMLPFLLLGDGNANDMLPILMMSNPEMVKNPLMLMAMMGDSGFDNNALMLLVMSGGFGGSNIFGAGTYDPPIAAGSK